MNKTEFEEKVELAFGDKIHWNGFGKAGFKNRNKFEPALFVHRNIGGGSINANWTIWVAVSAGGAELRYFSMFSSVLFPDAHSYDELFNTLSVIYGL